MAAKSQWRYEFLSKLDYFDGVKVSICVKSPNISLRRRCLQQRQFLKTVVQKGIQFTWKRSGSPWYLSDVVTRGVASQDYQRVVFIFIGEGEIRIGRESARTTGDHHVLRSAAAVHMADEKVTVALHLWVTLHYHAIITRPLSFFLPFLHYSSPSWNSSNLSKSFHFFF